MTLARLASTILVLSAAACVSRAPISQSPCPCPEGMGYVCCVGRCVPPTDTTCGSSSGMSGAAGTETHDAGGTAGNPAVGADARQVISRVVSVGIGAAHACIVRQDGSIECRGNNDKGQATPPAGTFLQVVAGAEHTCAQVQVLADRTKNGAWVCWGDNTYGQAPPSFGVSYDVTAGSRHTCYTDSNDKIICVGDNSLGQTSAPTVAAGYTVGALSAGRNHTCALVTVDNTIPVDGTMAGVTCWGDNSLGQSTPPTDVVATIHPEFLASGGDHTCASSDFLFSCWGANDVGQSMEPVGALRPLSLATGHSCAMPFDGLPATPHPVLGHGLGHVDLDAARWQVQQCLRGRLHQLRDANGRNPAAGVLGPDVRALVLTEPDELAAFWRGDDRAIETVYRAHVSALLVTGRFIVGPAEAESVVQEVFVELIRNEELRRRFTGGSLSGWLTAITRFKCLEHRKRVGQPPLADEAPASETQASPWPRLEARDLLERFARAALEPGPETRVLPPPVPRWPHAGRARDRARRAALDARGLGASPL